MRTVKLIVMAVVLMVSSILFGLLAGAIAGSVRVGLLAASFCVLGACTMLFSIALKGARQGYGRFPLYFIGFAAAPSLGVAVGAFTESVRAGILVGCLTMVAAIGLMVLSAIRGFKSLTSPQPTQTAGTAGSAPVNITTLK